MSATMGYLVHHEDLLDAMSEHWTIFRQVGGIRGEAIRCVDRDVLDTATEMKLVDLKLDGRAVFASDDFIEEDYLVAWIGTLPAEWMSPHIPTY